MIAWLNLKKAEAYRTQTKPLNTQKLCFIIDRSSAFVSIVSAETHSYFPSSSWSPCELQALLSSSLQQHETSGQLSLAHSVQGQISGWQRYYLLDVVALFSEREKTAFSFRWEVEIWKKMRSESLVWLLFSVLGGCGFKTRRGNLWFCLLIFPASRDSRNTHFNLFLMVVIVIVKVADICFTRFWDASVGWRL